MIVIENGGFMPAIDVKSRVQASKNEAKRLRREGFIPFVMYSKTGKTVSGLLPKVEFDAVLRNMRSGFLPTTVFELKAEDGKVTKAIVKDIQYHPTSYAVIHLDFLELHADQEINVKIPVEYLNAADCVGVKAGGFIRTVLRHVKVNCLPKDLPTHFEIDVRDMDMRDLRRVNDIQLPAGVVSAHKHNDIVVTIVKR